MTGLTTSCFTVPSTSPGLSTVPPLPNGNSCRTIALVFNCRLARCGCRGTMSMKSDNLIQKTCLRAKNLGRVSSSRLKTSVGLSRVSGTSWDIGLRSWRQREPRWLTVAGNRVQAVSGICQLIHTSTNNCEGVLTLQELQILNRENRRRLNICNPQLLCQLGYRVWIKF